jgi:hypothetical protein
MPGAQTTLPLTCTAGLGRTTRGFGFVGLRTGGFRTAFGLGSALGLRADFGVAAGAVAVVVEIAVVGAGVGGGGTGCAGVGGGETAQLSFPGMPSFPEVPPLGHG